MWRGGSLTRTSLILCGLAVGCFGFVLMPKEGRGWTLNSAGYLLGPNAAINKPGFTGKRAVFDDRYSSDGVGSSEDPFSTLGDALQALTDILAYSRLAGARVLGNLGHALTEQTQDA